MSIKHTSLVAAILVTMATATSAYASTNLVTNGGFEINGGNGQLGGGVSYATGWTSGTPTDAAIAFNFILDSNAAKIGFPSVNSPAAGTNIFVWGPDGHAGGSANGFTGSPDGGYFLGGDGAYATAAISQTISGLTAGTDYTLSFDWAQSQFNDAVGGTTSGWNVTFGSETGTTGTPSLASQGFSGWTNFTQIFTATSDSQVLSFLAVGTPSGLPPFALLDGVRLEVPFAPVPVPAALPLMASGLIGLFGLRRRKNAK